MREGSNLRHRPRVPHSRPPRLRSFRAKMMLLLARLFVAALLVFAIDHGAYGDATDQVFGRIVENLRWSHYWFGKTGIDDVYVEGKRISALIFWNKSESQPIRGLCSSEISLCVAYSGIYLDPAERRMHIPPNVA